jgi:hypothetical protein
MSLLQNLSLDTLTPARLWSALDPSTRTLAARAVYDGDPEMRSQADHAIATAVRFRPAGVRKLSVEKRIDYLVRVVQPDDALASSLLTALHLGCRQELLGRFLDDLGIPNEDGLIVSEHELEPIAPDQLDPAVGALRERFDRAEVELYLASLLVLDPDVWGGLTEVLRQNAVT